jgi:5-methylcytosine-specific restriction endonuclease McrA
MHIDHIKPKSKFPDLALTEENLQILCRDCNLGKSNRFNTDFRLK